jgi:hypothetical protein
VKLSRSYHFFAWAVTRGIGFVDLSRVNGKSLIQTKSEVLFNHVGVQAWRSYADRAVKASVWKLICSCNFAEGNRVN